MGNLLSGRGIENASIEAEKLTPQALISILGSKMFSLRNLVGAFNFPAAPSAVVTTQILAIAFTDVAVTVNTQEGIFTGAVAGPTDPYKVLVRLAGTDNALLDGANDEVYGRVSYSSGVYTLSLFTAAGAPFIPSAPISIDFYFVEIYKLTNAPAEAFIRSGISGAIDLAITASTFNGNKTFNGEVQFQSALKMNNQASAQSGTGITLTAPNGGIIRLTSNLLVSVTQITAPAGAVFMLINETGNPVTFVNGANLITTTGNDLILKNQASLLFVMLGAVAQVIGGSGAGGGLSYFGTAQSIADGAAITISLIEARQYRRVQGNAAAVTANALPFGNVAPQDAAEILLECSDDENTVSIPYNDVAFGCIGNFEDSLEISREFPAKAIWMPAIQRYYLQRGI